VHEVDDRSFNTDPFLLPPRSVTAPRNYCEVNRVIINPTGASV